MASLLSRSPLPTIISSTPTFRIRTLSTSSLPRILQPSLWSSILPRILRTAPKSTPGKWAARARNPTFPVTMLALLCGSQAIHVITLRNTLADSEALRKRKVGLLNDVIERIMRGEAVDVRKELGTGDETLEGEWREVVESLGDSGTWLREPKPRRKKVEEKVESEGAKFSLPSISWPSWRGTGEKSVVRESEELQVEEIPERPSFV